VPTDLNRDQWRARLAYIEAVRRLNRAMNAWDTIGLNVDPRSRAVAEPWTERQWAVMEAVAVAWVQVVNRRREYDSALHVRPTH
jgi:hypothetical protein